MATADGRVHAIGGRVGSWNNSAVHEVFDPETGAWTYSTPLPLATSALAAVAYPDGDIYAIAGDHLWRFDAATEEWFEGTAPPTSMYSPAAAVGGDGLIYVYGGAWRSAGVWAYDPLTGKWSKQPFLAEWRSDISGVADSEGSIWAIGGCGEYTDDDPLLCGSSLVERSITVDCTVSGTAADDALVGTPGDDVLCGLGGDDTLAPRGGNDVVIGGNGFDTGDYSGAPAPIDADLRDGVADGWGDDQLISVEGIVGSRFADHLDGNAYKNLLDGAAGVDSVAGREGNDRIFGGAGPDTLYPGLGSDSVSGGKGIDLIDYFVAPSAGVTISLAGEYASGGGWREVDTIFTSIENVNGSRFDDTILGTDGRNVLNGLDGDDEIFAYGGDDLLEGGLGDDDLDGGEGSDECMQGPGTGSMVDCEA